MHVFGVGDTLPEINAEESHLRPLISILQECRCAVPWYRPYVHGIERLCQVAQICIEQGLEVVDISPRKHYAYYVRNLRNNGVSGCEQRDTLLVQSCRKLHIGCIRIDVGAFRIAYGLAVLRRQGQIYIVRPIGLYDVQS